MIFGRCLIFLDSGAQKQHERSFTKYIHINNRMLCFDVVTQSQKKQRACSVKIVPKIFEISKRISQAKQTVVHHIALLGVLETLFSVCLLQTECDLEKGLEMRKWVLSGILATEETYLSHLEALLLVRTHITFNVLIMFSI